MFDLSGKAALVTGASGGIGGAIARALHKQGATVTLSGTRTEALGQLKAAIAHCESVHDYVSRDLFSDILENEEEHVDTLETQFEMMQRMGLENYVQLQSEPTKD